MAGRSPVNHPAIERFPESTTLSAALMKSTSFTTVKTAALIDLYGSIETPENVVLTYRLAGPALRAWAYLIDFAVRMGILMVSVVVLSMMELAVEGIPTGILFLLLFMLEWGYFAVFEGFFIRVKTIGKNLGGVHCDWGGGYPISFWSGLIRNFLRAADFLPFFYGFGFIAMMFSGKFRRLGDLAAGTVVIEERRVNLPREPIILEKIQPLARTDIGTYIPPHHTLVLIEEFLERRFVLTHQRGHEIAGMLAGVLAKKLDFQGEASFVEEYPMAFKRGCVSRFIRSQVREEKADAAGSRIWLPTRRRWW